jgi:hypothetical protein
MGFDGFIVPIPLLYMYNTNWNVLRSIKGYKSGQKNRGAYEGIWWWWYFEDLFIWQQTTLMNLHVCFIQAGS